MTALENPHPSEGQDLLLQFLAEVDKARTKEEACALAAEAIAAKTSFSRPAVYLWNEKKDHLDLAGYANHNPSVRIIRPDQGICGRAFRLRETQVVQDVFTDPDYFPDMSDTLAELAVPLVWHERLFGVLDIEAAEKNGFTRENVRFCKLLVGILGSVLSHLETREDLRKNLEQSKANRRNLTLAHQALNRSLEDLMTKKHQVEEYSRFRQILLDASGELFQCRDMKSLYAVAGEVLRERFNYQSSFIFGKYDRKSSMKTLFSHGTDPLSTEEEEKYLVRRRGIVGRVIASLMPYICNDTEKDTCFTPDSFGTQSEIAFPIAHGDFLWGVLVVTSLEKNAFSSRDVETFTLLTSYMALMLENIANLGQLRRELQGMRFLHDMANALSGERSSQGLARRTVALLTDRFPETSMHIWLYEKEELRIVGSSEIAPEDFRAVAREVMERGGGLISQCLREKRIRNTGDIRNDARYIQVRQGVLSEMDVPILHRGEVFGAIALERPTSGGFSREDAELFQVLSQHLGALLSLNRLLDAEEEKARKDSLTGIWNRRFLFQYLESEVFPLVEEGMPCGVVMVDMREFKNVNDTYGHAVGDEVLMKVARAMTEDVGDQGLVGRYGGDEFLVVLPGLTPSAIRDIVARLDRGIRGLSFSVEHLSASANFGVAFFPEDGTSCEDVLFAADQRMYASKGRALC